MPDPRSQLIALLRLAYSGELAAALAYDGHWRSTRDVAISDRIREIEQEELHHRELVGAMLLDLGAWPDRSRERRASTVGSILGALCHVSGTFAPLYGAGKLERKNIVEYETAARLASAAGLDKYVDCLLMMAEVEWEHEKFFRESIRKHWLVGVVSIWDPPPPKEEIRASFERDCAQSTPTTIAAVTA